MKALYSKYNGFRAGSQRMLSAGSQQLATCGRLHATIKLAANKESLPAGYFHWSVKLPWPTVTGALITIKKLNDQNLSQMKPVKFWKVLFCGKF